MIEEGRITVNGKKAESGQKVSLEDEVCADNIPVHKNEKKVLLLFNKPRGIVCSTKQQFDETTVTDYLDYPLRVYPVGRLDKESQGLLLLTNEGNLVNKIMRAGNYHEKEYFVTVNKPVDREFVRRMSKGVPVLDTVTRPCRVVQTGECSFRIILTQGLNRQIRRMCRYLGYEVQKLKRIRIMNLTLDGIKEGEYREITAQEWEELNHLLESSTSETVIRTGDKIMPRKIQSDLPVKEILEKENIFVMDESRASHQDIRPIQILILNLMPLKEETELQLLRSLSNTPLQVDVTFMAVQSHEAKNTSVSHLNKFYQTFPELKNNKYDGMIITGAPVEQMEFEEVDYWKELVEIMDWTNTHVTSTICAGLHRQDSTTTMD